jgi:hypothetical protein
MATYKDTVLADGPLNYYMMDSASTASNGASVTNFGSVGGSAAITQGQTGTLAVLTPGAGTTGGGYWGTAAANTAYGQQSIGTVASSKNFSFEFWYKAGSGFAAYTAYGIYPTPVNFSGNTANLQILDQTTGRIWITKNGTKVQEFSVGTALTDWNWHHFVVTYDGATLTLYMDGVSKGTFSTTTFVAFTTGNVQFGSTNTGGLYGGGVDEVQFYNKVLTSAQVTAHYNAGVALPSTPVTVTPPLMQVGTITAPSVIISTEINRTVTPPAATASLDSVTPSILITKDATCAVPAMTGDISIPNGAVSATYNLTVAAPATTASLAAPSPTVYMVNDISVSAPAMTVSLAAPAATVTAQYKGRFAVTQDGDYNVRFGTGNEVYINGGGAGAGYFKFANITVPDGYAITKVTANFYAAASTSTYPLTAYRLTADWTEAGLGTSSSNATTVPRETTRDYGTSGSLSPTTWFQMDITPLAQGWIAGTFPNYGLALKANGGQSGFGDRIASREVSGGTQAAYLDVEYAKVNTTSVTVLPITADLGAPSASVSTFANQIVPAPAITAGLVFADATVSAMNPDFTGVASVISVDLSAPVADVAVRYPVTVIAPSMYVGNLESEPITINLTTNRLAVAPAMKMTMKWIGIYVEEADRYLNRLSAQLTGSNDVWYKLGNEAAGATRATDAAGVAWNGYIFGAPEFGIADGPELRKAAHFDGIDDYLVAGPYSDLGIYNNSQRIVPNDHAVTIEFSIRTTQLDGTVFNATGGGNGAFAAISQTYFPYPAISKKLNLKNGYLHVIDDTAGTKILTRSGFISDGEWHHIVMSVPVLKPQSGLIDELTPSYVMVDGKVVLSRYGLAGGEAWAPYAFMADAEFKAGAYNSGGGGSGNGGPPPVRGNATGYLNGDLRDVIVRLNTYVDVTTSQTTYYEWSNAAVVNPEPITVNLSGIDPFKVKGNTKRLLAIYGLPTSYYGATGMVTGFEPLNTYQSKWSGFVIKSFESEAFRTLNYPEPSRTGWHRVLGGGIEWQIPAVFQIEDYVVYPVAIRGGNTSDIIRSYSTVPSADGILNPDSELDSNGTFVDYETGMPRFINLQEDLAENVTDFDAITVVNYPWVAPNGYAVPSTGYNNPGTAPLDAPEFGMFQKDFGMSISEWGVARDNLRDSILEAVYDGVSLWIGEYHMAQHLGIIKDVDFHDAGWFSNFNYAAQAIDAPHLAPGYRSEVEGWIDNGNGYFAYPQMNIYRRIVSEVPGLTDLPTAEISAMVEGWSKDEWRPNGSFLAYDFIKRPNGLTVGDKSWMNVMFRRETKWDTPTESQMMTGFEPSKRIGIVSARPEGIVGRVVTREDDFYYGKGKDAQGNPVVVPNPYKNNAYTIAVERGSVVRGRPTRGRIFVELMEFGTDYMTIQEDKNKMRWHGDNVVSGPQPSNWMFDTRRYKEVKLQNVASVLSFDSAAITGVSVKSVITNYFQYEDFNVSRFRSPSWHLRGMHWLALTPDVNGDDFVAYAPPMTVDLGIPAPVHSNTKNPVSAVLGMMRLDLEARQPQNYRDGDVVERTLPIELSLELRGIGSSSTVPPMVATLTVVAPVIDAETETITLFMDNVDTLTLFIKEEN